MNNLSEEEKKAIEFSEELHEVVKKAMEVKYRDNELKALQTIIKKQQKEIEELKEKQTAFKEFKEELKPLIKNEVIHKDKIRELQQEIHIELDKNAITRGYQLIIDNKFKKLLKEE